MDSAEEDVLPRATVPTIHRTKLHSTNPIRNDIITVGIFQNESAVVKLVGARLLEQSGE